MVEWIPGFRFVFAIQFLHFIDQQIPIIRFFNLYHFKTYDVFFSAEHFQFEAMANFMRNNENKRLKSAQKIEVSKVKD